MLECVLYIFQESKQALRIGLALTLAVPQLTSASFRPLLSTNMTMNGKTVSNRKELKLNMHEHLRIIANKNANTANQRS